MQKFIARRGASPNVGAALAPPGSVELQPNGQRPFGVRWLDTALAGGDLAPPYNGLSYHHRKRRLRQQQVIDRRDCRVKPRQQKAVSSHRTPKSAARRIFDLQLTTYNS